MRIVSPLLLILLALMAWVGDARLSIIFTLAYLAIALIPWSLGRYLSSFDPFDPYFGLSVLFLLYSISTLQFVEQNQISYNLEAVTSSSLVLYVFVCLTGQFGLALGYLMVPMYRLHGAQEIGNEKSDARIRLLLGSALILSILLLPFYIERFNFLDAVSYADFALQSRIMRMADAEAGIKSVFLKDAPLQIVLCASTLMLFDPKRSMRVKGGAALVLGIYIYTSFLLGARSQIVLGALLPVMFFHYRVRKLPMIIVILGGGLTYLMVNALSVMRSSSDLGVMITLLLENISDNGLAFIELSNSGELATSSNLLTLIMGISDGRSDFSWGGLFLSQFGAFIPRALWADRPAMASELFVQRFFPGIYESGGGYGLFFHQEGYWDFGLAGVMIYAVMLGWLTGWIYANLIIKRPGSFSTLLYSVLYGTLVLGVVRSGLVGSIKGALMTALPLLVIFFLVKNRKSSIPLSGDLHDHHS